MNGYLLDTHALLWWLSAPEELPETVRALIAEREHTVLVSAAAIWEMSIKRALRRLSCPANLLEVLQSESIEVLPIAAAHALAVADLPLHHQDPFDRMQVAQARVEGLSIITRDGQIGKYDVEVVWR